MSFPIGCFIGIVWLENFNILLLNPLRQVVARKKISSVCYQIEFWQHLADCFFR